MPEISITVDGRPALTTALAAQRHGRTIEAMRKLLSATRLGLDPVAELDSRTPLYDLEALDTAIENMVGRGKGGGRPSGVRSLRITDG